MSNIDTYDYDNKLNICLFAPKKKTSLKHSSKKIKYKKQRQEIFDKMCDILDMKEAGGIYRFYLYDLEIDKEKVDLIVNLKDDIGKYFTSKNNIVFKNPAAAKKVYTSLIRAVFKEFNYEFFTTSRIITRNNYTIDTIIYLIVPVFAD
jgi:hypothetical protein